MKNNNKQRYIARRKHKTRIPKIIFIILFGIFAALLYGGILFNLNQYKSFFEQILAEKLNANISIGSISLKLIGKDAFNLHNVKVSDKSSNNFYFQAEEFLFNLDFKEFFTNKRIYFTEINIKNPVLKFRKDENGKFNFNNYSKKSGEDLPSASKPKDQPKKKLFSFLSLHKWIKLDYSSFLINNVNLESGNLEILDSYDKEILYLADINIGFSRKKNKNKVNFLMEAFVNNNPAEKIRLDGFLNYNKDDIIQASIPEIFKNSFYCVNYSFDNIKSDSIYSFFNKQIPFFPKLQNIAFSLCGAISGSANNNIILSGRINPKNLKNNSTLLLDYNLKYNTQKKYLTIKNIFALLNDTPVLADGQYYFSSKTGEIFLQTDIFDIEKMSSFLKFIKRLNIEGKASLNTIVDLSRPKFRPAVETTVLLTQFTGHFKTLSRPIQLNKPCIGTITKDKIIFQDASISFGENPLYLTLTYIMKKADEKLYLELKNLSGIDLLDIFKATNKKINANKNKERTGSKAPVTESTVTQRSYSKNNRRKKLPIYVSGLIRNTSLNTANFSSIYVDILFEQDRMLFKDININLYNGNFRGNGVITLSQKNPEYSFVGDFDEININSMLNDTTNLKNIIDGTMNAAISFQCKGRTKQTISKTLTGRGILKIVEGKITNLPLLRKMLSQLSNKNQNRRINIFGNTIGLNIPPIEEFNFAKETPFNSLKCDFEIKPNEYGKNAFHTNELKIESTNMIIWMSGNFDFKKNLYFSGHTILSKVQTTKLLHKVNELSILFQVKNNLMEIPFKLNGSFSNPQPTPIIKLNGIQNKIEELFRKKLLSTTNSSPDNSNTDEDKSNILDKKGVGITDKDIEKIEKLEKKIKKYLK